MAPCARTLEAGLSRDAESARIAQMEVVIAQADLQIDCVAVVEAIEQVLAPHGYRVAIVRKAIGQTSIDEPATRLRNAVSIAEIVVLL